MLGLGSSSSFAAQEGLCGNLVRGNDHIPICYLPRSPTPFLPSTNPPTLLGDLNEGLSKIRTTIFVHHPTHFQTHLRQSTNPPVLPMLKEVSTFVQSSACNLKICSAADLPPGKCRSGLNAPLILICDYPLNQDKLFPAIIDHLQG